jgi:hypothetical protein
MKAKKSKAKRKTSTHQTTQNPCRNGRKRGEGKGKDTKIADKHSSESETKYSAK